MQSGGNQETIRRQLTTLACSRAAPIRSPAARENARCCCVIRHLLSLSTSGRECTHESASSHSDAHRSATALTERRVGRTALGAFGCLDRGDRLLAQLVAKGAERERHLLGTGAAACRPRAACARAAVGEEAGQAEDLEHAPKIALW